MTGTFGRLTVIGVQSPVVGATPVVTTGAGFGAAAVVDGAVIVGAISGRRRVRRALVYVVGEKRGDHSARRQCARHQHDGEPAPWAQKRHLR